MAKFELLAGFLMSAMSLMLRIQIYGVEQTLVSSALEFGVKTVKAAGPLFHMYSGSVDGSAAIR